MTDEERAIQEVTNSVRDLTDRVSRLEVHDPASMTADIRLILQALDTLKVNCKDLKAVLGNDFVTKSDLKVTEAYLKSVDARVRVNNEGVKTVNGHLMKVVFTIISLVLGAIGTFIFNKGS